VGFGDIAPVSGLGRIVGGLLMVSGMMALGLFTGIVSQTLPRAIANMREEQLRMSADLNHLVVCGYELGARMFLDSMMDELDLERSSVVLFGPGERPAELPPEFTWVPGDPTKESELDKLRLPWAAGVVLIGRRSLSPQQADAVTILTAFTIRSFLEKHGVPEDRARPISMVAEVLEAENVEHLRTAGADEVVETTRLGFSLLAHSITMPGTASLMSRFAGAGDNSLYVGHCRDEGLDDRPFSELAQHVKSSTGALVLGIRDPETGDDQINPPDDLIIAADTPLLYLAKEPVLPST
jgi:voltage-gated potassium channel